MVAKTPPSPDGLSVRAAPLTSARLSPKAALIAVAVLVTMFGVVLINVSKDRPRGTAKERAAPHLQPALSEAETLTIKVPDVADTSKPIAAPVLPVEPTAKPVTRVEGRAGVDPALAREQQARMAGTEIPDFSDNALAQPPSGIALSRVAESPELARSASGADAPEESDLNRQAEKLAFLKESRESAYLPHERLPPRNLFELKTGTVIPGVLLSELNSDLPGEIVAQVAQNVYDTASGNHLLIPQGTKLFGQYDSKVAFGQARLLVSWQRLIFPDASTLELDGMGGYDRGGNSGFAGRVNHHYGRMFGFALLTSAISAGYQISQPQQDSTLEPLSEQQIAAGAVGQQMAQLGTEIARRNMRVQPTITIQKGYRLHVMVNKDIAFSGSYR